jgi:hypothetical protein
MFSEKRLARCHSYNFGTNAALPREVVAALIWRIGIKVALESSGMMAPWPFLRRFCPLFILVVLASARLQAATYNALSPNRTDVATAVASAVDGDTVLIPAGTATWSQGLSTSKAISIKGGGVGVTVIVAGYTNQYGGGMIAYTPGSAQATKVFELSGCTFNCMYRCGGFSANPPSSTTPITGLKIHDNQFLNCFSRAIVLTGLEFGVFYRNQFQDNYIAISVIGSEMTGWNYPYAQGGPNYPFFEDNTFVQTVARGGFIVETGRGGRIVFRHNTITGYGGGGAEVWDAHGVNGTYPTDTGTVSIEYYNNNIQLSASSRVLNHRGGRAIVFDNVVTGAGGYFSMTEYQGWSYCTAAGYPKPQQVNNSYYWNNTSGGNAMNPTLTCSSGSCSSCGQYDSMYIQLNRDYWLPTRGVDSAKGSSCTQGAFYGATDTGKLYNCNGSSWALQYTPYTYPHPLISGASATNAAISVNPGGLDFGVVNVGSHSNMTFRVQNIGGSLLTGSASVAAPFAIVSGGSYSLASNQSQVVTISFNPTQAGGANQSVQFTGGGGATATVSGAAPLGLSFPSIAGATTAPFTVTPNNTISQTTETVDPSQGGRASYYFNVPSAGNYTVSANVLAPSDSANSLFVNIDGEPTSPTMVWDIPVYAGFTNQLVSWRGTGPTPISPQVWTLTAGIHQLIIRGREAGVEFGLITIAPFSGSITKPPAPTNLRTVASGL